MPNYIIPDTDEHKEEPQSKQDAFKLKLKMEREQEEKMLEKRQAEEALMRAMKSRGLTSIPIPTPTPKPKKKRVYKKRVKKVSKENTPPPSPPKSPSPELKLPVYHTKIEVNEFNKFKVDYIRAQIFHCKDKRRKTIYENALTKYDMSNYNNLK